MKKLLLTTCLAFLITALFDTQSAYAQPCVDNPVAVSLNSFSENCVNFVCTSVTGGTTPYQYQYTLDGMPYNALNTNGCEMFFGQAGFYTVTITDANGCIATAGTFITGIIFPYIEIITTPISACGVNDGALSVIETIPNPQYAYQWSNGATTPYISNLGAGTYCVTVFDDMDCSGTQCVTLSSSIATTTQSATCGWCNGSITLPPISLDSLNTDTALYLVIGPNLTTQSYTAGQTITGLCAGSYQIMSQTGANCNSTVVIENIELDAIADATFSTSVGSADNLNSCTGQAIQFTALGEENLLLAWDFGEPTATDNNSDLNNPTHTYNDAGSYTITLIAQGCNTVDTVQKTILVQQGQAPDITCVSLQCPNDTVTYTTAMVCDNYQWTVNGATVVGATNNNEVTVIWNNAPQGTISLTVGNCDGVVCNNTTTLTVPLLTNLMPIAGNNVVCGGDLVFYNLPSFGGVSYQWAISPSNAGTIVTGQGSPQIAIQWGNGIDAVIGVTLGSVLLECNPTTTLPVQVNNMYSITGDENVCNNSDIIYQTSSAACNWSVTGNASIISGANGSTTCHVLSGNSGTYTISATPTNTDDYCNYPQTITATITDTPATPSISGENMICSDHAYNYQINAPDNAFTYQWTVTGGTPSIAEGNNVWITFDNSGVYNISVVKQQKTVPFCSSLPAQLNPTMPNSIAITGDNSICAGDKATYTALPLLTDINYEWSITPTNAGSVIAGQHSNEITVQWNSNVLAATLQVAACSIVGTSNITINSATLPTITQSNELCTGSNVTLSTTVPYNNYEWNTSANSPTISVNAGGNYAVTVTDNNSCTATGFIDVHEYALPDAAISASEYPVICIEAPINVPINALVNPEYTYQWFQNGTAVGTNSPIYTHIGTAEVSSTTYYAIITNAQGCQSTSNNIVVSQMDCFVSGAGGGCGGSCPGGGGGGSIECVPAPTDFIGLQAQEPHCNTVNFDNLSNGISYQWDFGDGSPIENTVGNVGISHTYFEPGFYSVLLYGTYNNTNALPATCVYAAVEIVEIPLVAGFDYENPCLNSATQFTDISRHTTGTNITNWSWDFGDGNTATDQNPTHIYSNAGTYLVSLVVSNGFCSASISRNITINTLPNANFNSPATICQYETAVFTPLQTNDIVQYTWDFGDNASVKTALPEHSYLDANNFDINLTITDNKGCTNTATNNITVLPVGTGAITANQNTACVGDVIVLTAPTGATYLWSDGSSNATLNVTNSGTYGVTVTQANACQFVAEPITLNFAPLPTANIYPDSSPVVYCPGDSKMFSADAGNNYTYAWSNGNNQSNITITDNNFTSPYNLNVTVTNSTTGCSAVSNTVVLTKTNVAPPTIAPANNVQICLGGSTTLTASHPTLNNFVWNNGENDNSITVNQAGIYTVSVSDANGCVNHESVTVNVNTGLDMSVVPTGCYEYCEGEPISIPNTFMGGEWLLDGQPIFMGQYSNFIPTVSGNYQLIAYSMFGCADTSDVLSLTLKNCSPCEITADFSSTAICNTLSFTDLSVGNGTISTTWNFGDGTPPQSLPAGGNTTHTFSAAGNYNICLTALNTLSNGDTCSATKCYNTNVVGNDIIITTDEVSNANCNTANGAINISVNGGALPYTYTWSNDEVTQDLNNINAGYYIVTVTDNNGCQANQGIDITTLPLLSPTIVCDAITDSEINFTWDNIADALGYQVTIAIGSAGSNVYTITDPFYLVTGLSPETEVIITVVALAPNGCINSVAVSNACSTTEDPCNSLPAPVISCTNITENSIDFEWDNVNDAIGYTITLTINGIAQAPFDATTTGYTASGLLPETSVSISVIALNTTNCINSEPAMQSCITLPSIASPCPSNPINLEALVTDYCLNDPAVSLNVSPPDGAFLSDFVNAGIFDPHAANVGQHNVSYHYTQIINGITCEYDTSFVLNVSNVVINNIPQDTIQLPANITNIPFTINATSTSGGVLTYTWTENGVIICEGTDCQTQIISPPNDINTYTVVVTDEYGCAASFQTIIITRKENTLIVPNAFSPNGDGINETFRIFGQNIASYQLIVFDRIGHQVYDSQVNNNIEIGWNGKRNDSDAELAVYCYYVLATFEDGKQDMRKGNVTLIR